MKTVVLGFDALDARYLDRYADALPNFRRLRSRGVEASLESTHPPWTGSAWPSLYTGTDPSHHGVYDFFSSRGYPDEADLVTRGDVDRPAIWNYLSADGAPSVVLNVPVTHPADRIEGVLLPGYLAAEDEPGHPRGVRNDLGESIGEEYTIYSDGEISDDPDEKFDGYLELLDRRRRAGLALLSEHEWEFAFLQVQKTDAVFHNFDDEDRFRAVYRAADRFLGDVLDLIDEETNVVVCSDHGIGPVDGYEIYVNELLRDGGFVTAAEEPSVRSLGLDKRSLLDGDEGSTATASSERSTTAEGSEPTDGPVARTARIARSVAERVGVEPSDVYAVAERIGVEEALVRLTPSALREGIGRGVDWRRSTAFCPSASLMGVRINLEGREPNGRVPRSEYEAVRQEIVDHLSAVRTPDGDPAFEFVRPRDELYDGPRIEDAPDVVFLPAGMNHTVSTVLYGQPFVPHRAYDHKTDGVFLGAGPGFRDGATVDRLSITDVAPIAMALLGRPVPARMTGTVPDDLLAVPVSVEEYGDVPFATGRSEARGRSDAPDESMTDRLEDLGYL